MKNILRKWVRESWLLNLLPRFFSATRYYNHRYLQIVSWLFKSNEYTNFTYELSDDNVLVMAECIGVCTGKSSAEILRYINEVRTNEVLGNHIARYARDNKEVARNMHKKMGKRMGWYAVARACKPTLVVETGVDKGLGSVILAAALLKNAGEGHPGKYLGTDINPKAGALLTEPYSQMGKIAYGDSISTLRTISEPIGLFINDSDHSSDYEMREYETIADKLAPNAIIIGDNAHVTDKLLHFSVAHGRRFLFFQEKPLNHWYPGGGIGISFVA
jgi:predicted O-methyltransferase YrrM